MLGLWHLTRDFRHIYNFSARECARKVRFYKPCTSTSFIYGHLVVKSFGPYNRKHTKLAALPVVAFLSFHHIIFVDFFPSPPRAFEQIKNPTEYVRAVLLVRGVSD